MHLSTLPGVWISALLTLGIFSFLYKDNPVYKFCEHLFVGISAGYWVVLTYYGTIKPNLVDPLFGVPFTFDGERLRGTSPTGTLGLRLGAHSPDGIMWWLSGKLNYTKLNQFNRDALHELSTNQFEPKGLDPISSVVNFAITLGVGL